MDTDSDSHDSAFSDHLHAVRAAEVAEDFAWSDDNDDGDAEHAKELERVGVFRLTDLPDEIQLVVVQHVDERDPSPTFPRGPSRELLNLSRTSRFFHGVCSPLIWRSVHYRHDDVRNRYRAIPVRKHRDLATLQLLLRWRRDQGRPLPILCFSVQEILVDEYDYGLEPEPHDALFHAFLDVISILSQSGLQVLFLKELEIPHARGLDLIRYISSSPTISAVRVNQVDFWPRRSARPLVEAAQDPLPHIKTLQIMHSDPCFSDLISRCPNIDSLLLWPSTRRLGEHTETIKRLLPHLRNLSLDAVHEAEVFRSIADELLRLYEAGAYLPLEELFLEGPSQRADLSVLLSALSRLPCLRRLALYQLLDASPAVVADVVEAVPAVEALTLVHGDCQSAEEWPAPLDAYLPLLAKLTHLRFFAWDRRTPQPSSPRSASPLLLLARGAAVERVKQNRLEFETLSQLARACKSLREGVCITQDVSEGTTGFFARFEPDEKRRVRITVNKKVVQDFLISYDRWIKVEED
ncbi:uncharacterized protein JCM10292_007163 [Rhodotorula paludigena]|uniref:uncharacterized protein n=1 Tax=Rhodotorula paludigena TaxID=86838 RepID=UPI00317B4B25